MGICCSDEPESPGRGPSATPQLNTDIEIMERWRVENEGHYQELHKLIEAVRQKPHKRWFIVVIGDRELSRPIVGRMAKEYKKMGYDMWLVKRPNIGSILKFARHDQPKHSTEPPQSDITASAPGGAGFEGEPQQSNITASAPGETEREGEHGSL